MDPRKTSAGAGFSHLEDGLKKNLALDFFDEEEIGAVLQDIDSLGIQLKQKTLALCLDLSSASSSLVPSTVRRIKEAASRLSSQDMGRWITAAYDLLDSRAIDSFMKFINSTDEDSLREFRRPKGLRLHDVSVILETCLRGISGMDLKVAEAAESYTDTNTVYLPPVLDFFEATEKNFLLYKIMSVHKWAQIVLGTLTPAGNILRLFITGQGSRQQGLEELLGSFPNKELAADLYNVIESFRIASFLQRELPVLMRETEEVQMELFRKRQPLSNFSEKTALVEGLFQYFLAGSIKGEMSELLASAIGRSGLISQARDPYESIRLLFDLCDAAARLTGDYNPLNPPAIIGIIKPDKVSGRLRAEREARMERLEGMIAGLISMPDTEFATPLHDEALTGERVPKPEGDYLIIKGKIIELDGEMKEILEELADISGGILVKGSDIGSARRSILLKEDLMEEAAIPLKQQQGGIKYDEWDYKRGGYKKDWCSLYEQDIHPGSEPFVELALKRYGGYVTILRKKFELLKREPKTLSRQRDGDDIDIDAIIEAFSDTRAGITPHENFYLRQDRAERNIAVLFLVDMSGSTKGWVNEAEKEAIVLMCEALEALGDRYAIYGFSGMTRTRSDFYIIKRFGEAYADAVKKRIAGISPKDYTRMGPAIRHSIKILDSVEARTKLLITLSDGKPEDWDAYKGDYGIEDTRKALLEAKERGIHPFCITIDTQASSYLPHMYGDSKYIVIDDVRKLPGRITEIYRALTH